MKRAFYHGSVKSAADFLLQQYSSPGINILIHRLRRCESVHIQLFNGDHTGNRNHWSLAVLRKQTETIYLYDSLSLLPNLRILAKSIHSKLGTESTSWPRDWSISAEVRSIQQSNTDDSGIFTMFKAFFTSRGVFNPEFTADKFIYKNYRFTIALCLLAVNLSFLLKMLFFTTLHTIAYFSFYPFNNISIQPLVL